jgi:beta-mannosidase
MSGTVSLSGVWDLTYAQGSKHIGPDYYSGPKIPGHEHFQAKVPSPIHHVLMEAGILDDPNFGMNSLKARWVEEVFWVYRRTFDAPQEALSQAARLEFDLIEYDAKVYLNGEEVGHHANANRPARFDVSGKLQAGENTLVVVVETGVFALGDKSAQSYTSGGTNLINKLPLMRKPIFQSVWDWNPWLINVGILGDVRLTWRKVARLDDVSIFAVPCEDLSKATIHVRATIEGVTPNAANGILRAKVVETGQTVELPVEIAQGKTQHEVLIEIDNPRLWWPTGHGEQFRYTVEVTLDAGGETEIVTRKIGIRRVEVDQSPHPVTGKHFTLKINNQPIFCKGGNWVPADMVYSAVTRKRTQALVDMAAAANFNLLRIWGGGCFASEELCDACDEAGIMLWHDFLFACSGYPADDPAFALEVRKEARHAVRSLAHHPCIVVWSGNNEIDWLDWGSFEATPPRQHAAIFHVDLPRVVREHNPSTFYWPSSPWSGDYIYPNDPTVGDQHPWNVSLGAPGGADWWLYRSHVDRFANEGGVLGVSSPATIRQMLPESQQRMFSPGWQHHDNTFAMVDSDPAKLGRAYQTVQLWTGRDPLHMDWEEYAIVSAMLQAEGLGEYIDNYRRRMFSSSCAVFWMYNDSWPVTHGWTIVDYYLRKKLAYHPVRRAFQPVTVVVTEEDGKVTVYGVNDSPTEWSGELRWGIFKTTGGIASDETQPVTLPANASTPVAQVSLDEWKTLGLKRTGAFATLSKDGAQIAQHRLFLERFKDLELAEPSISIEHVGDTVKFTSDAFAWRVCLDVEGEMELSDNCFDLIPGVPYTIRWSAELGEPKVVTLGNRFVLKGN